MLAGHRPRPGRVVTAGKGRDGPCQDLAEPGLELPLGIPPKPADLTVHLQRVPEGDWIGLDARTLLSVGAPGLAESVVHDQTGRAEAVEGTGPGLAQPP